MPTHALMRPPATPEANAVPYAFSSRHFLKLIEETGKVGFWSADLRTERLSASLGLYRILGLDPAMELTFGFGLDMIHPEDQATHRDQIAVLRSGQSVSREFRIVRPDRTQRWILHQAEAILGPDGVPCQGMGVVFDVTAQHDALRALLQRHDRLNALIAATASVFWVNKANGEPSEMPQWMALTGQTHAQMQGFGWLDAVHPEDRPRTLAAWTTAVEHTAPYNTDYRVLCADGIYRWFNARGAPVLDRDGSVREWVGVCLSVPGRTRYGAARSEAPAAAPRAAPVADETLTPAQVRGARAMAGLSKEELAALANVSVSTVNRLEAPGSAVRPRADTLLAVRRALEASGVAFTFEPGLKPGLREA
ncbi:MULTISPECIES: PAS domain-containing protein [Methylobacterium]|jgi:PAS domain S-box-containing protein|uniref:PAS domain-containing protein n=2 Tax=Methylobacteriaceae TaxID=119045 RepID=UPI0008E9EA7D|nr:MULTISPECIES: PAS domain-containing protein [Methylobacterium]MBZ6416033.1 PAS domain-containing protein [Methylobacterium sp.]SFF01632.1 PAS domain S-box-containing protein [Methylobacterium sp. yr596]